jgi:Lysine-specific metallo-endopeptidase
MNQPKRDDIADPGIETVLECRIEAASEYQFGQPIAINGTLHNSGSSDVWALVRNTFLDPNWQDCVSLAHKGSSVPYTGVMVFHGTPSRDSYIRVPAGESVLRQIDLSQNYAITEPGDYEVSFYMPILGAVDEGASEPPTDEKALELTLVESAKASFRVSGVASTPLNKEEVFSPSATSPQASFPIQPKEPRYSELNQDQKDAMHRAHFTAYNNILRALDSVQEDFVFDNLLYRNYFDFTSFKLGAEERQRGKKVIETLSKMANLMSTEPPITYGQKEQDPNCPFDRLAYTYLYSRKVFACSKLFNDDLLRFLMWNSAEWGRAFAVVHEISHAAGGTTDDWYSWEMCKNLAFSNPDLAVTNAQNYALYVMLREGGSLPMTKRYRVRCYDEKSNTFLGWLDSSGNSLCLTGNDPAKPAGTIVCWYEYGGEKFIWRTDSSRYIGDDGNQGQGNTKAYWNLWARITAVEWTEPTGQICISANKSQHLSKGDDGLYWSANASSAIRFEFIEV